MENTVRIVLADDHPIFRKGLRGVLENVSGLDVVAEAGDGEAALASIREHRPDIAILDLDMPLRDGFGVVEEMQVEALEIPVILLTLHRSEALLNKAFDLGIKGFVLKDAAIDEIVECIWAVHAGDNYISPLLASFVVNRAKRIQALDNKKPGLRGLTPMELRILRMIAEQRSSKDIADTLFISVRTVERHRSNICEKLDLHGVNALTKFAVSHRSDL